MADNLPVMPSIANTAFGKTVHIRFGIRTEAPCPRTGCDQPIMRCVVRELENDGAELGEWLYCPVHGVLRHHRTDLENAYGDPAIERGVAVLLTMIGSGIKDTWPKETPPIRQDGPTEGWAWPVNSRKAHYFRESRSLCGRWGFFGSAFDPSQQGQSPDDCTDCRRRRDREESRAKTTAELIEETSTLPSNG